MIKRTIYVGNPAYLSLSSRQMVIRRPSADDVGKDMSGSIPVEDIGVVVI